MIWMAAVAVGGDGDRDRGGSGDDKNNWNGRNSEGNSR
jgi:hypothetical protein